MSIASEIERIQNAKASLKTSIENKGVEVGNGTIDTYASKIEPVYQKGIADEKKRFWDIFQNYGRRTEYRNAFYSWLWRDSIYEPIHTIVCSNNSSEMFRYNTSITDTKVDIDFSYANSSYVFSNTGALKTIRKLKLYENVTYTGWFSGATALENITIEGTIGNIIEFYNSTNNTGCPLTRDSLISIMSALKSGVNKDLVIGPDNIAKLSSDDIKIATNKGWSVK